MPFEETKARVLQRMGALANKDIDETEAVGLFAQGSIGSFEYVTLVVELENHFQIEFDADRMTASSFGGFDELVAYIETKLTLADKAAKGEWTR